MATDLLSEAAAERRKRQEQEELIRPLWQGFERLLETHGTPVHKLDLWSRVGVFVSSMLGGKSDSARLLASLGDLRRLEVILGRRRDQVQVAIWDWFDSQIVIQVEGLLERLVLKAALVKSRIEEWGAVADLEGGGTGLVGVSPIFVPVPIPQELKIEERWIPIRFPSPEDIARYQELLEDLVKTLPAK